MQSIFFCMLKIPSVWMDCLSCRFRICSLYVLLVFKRSAMMLTNCIHRYVLFIARLKGIYTYYEEKSWKKSMSTVIPCEHGSPLLAFVTDIVLWLCILIWWGWKRTRVLVLVSFHLLLIYFYISLQQPYRIRRFCEVSVMFPRTRPHLSLYRKWFVQLNSTIQEDSHLP